MEMVGEGKVRMMRCLSGTVYIATACRAKKMAWHMKAIMSQILTFLLKKASDNSDAKNALTKILENGCLLREIVPI